MGKFIISLLEKLSNINIEELQSDNARLQGETVKLNTLIREANQQLYSAERKIEHLQAQCDEFDPERQKAELEHLREQLFQEKEQELKTLAQDLEVREFQLRERESELQHNCLQQELALQEAERRLQQLQHQLAEMKLSQNPSDNDTYEEPADKFVSIPDETSREEKRQDETATSCQAMNPEDEPAAEEEEKTFEMNPEDGPATEEACEMNSEDGPAAEETCEMNSENGPAAEETCEMKVITLPEKDREATEPIAEKLANTSTAMTEKEETAEHSEGQTISKEHLEERTTENNTLATPELSEPEIENTSNQCISDLDENKISVRSDTESTATTTETKRVESNLISPNTPDPFHQTIAEKKTNQTEINHSSEMKTDEMSASEEDTEEGPFSIECFNELKSKFPFIKVTMNTYTQYIFSSADVKVAVGLFETGIDGHELISDKSIYLEGTNILGLEGLDTPFSGKEIQCDFSNEEVSEQAAQILLTAICTSQPLYATYDDKNGHITERNMYFICFKPKEKRFTLPYKNQFADLFNEEQELDTDNIAAMTQKQADPKIFSVSQILTLRPYNAFVSTPQGIKYIKEGIRIAKKNDQKDFAKLIKSEIRKRIPTMPQKLLGR